MILTEFCENSKVVSSDFLMMKNIVALSSSSLPTTLICCFKLGFPNSICLLKSITIVYNAPKNTHSPINYQLCNRYF